MSFHAISSHVDLLVLSYKGPSALERIGWGSIENVIHSGENSPCPALGTSLCSFLYRKENRCLPEHATHIAEKKLPPRCSVSLSLSLSLSQATQQPSRSDTHLKLDRLNLGFRMLSFITHMWSSTQSVRYLTWPCLQLGALAGGLAACSWAHHPFQVRGWLGILKLNVSLDVMAMKPSTINSKLCTIATNQPFPQVL